MLKWKHKTLVKGLSFSNEVTQLFLSDKDNIIAAGFDTETTGLHIIIDRPFLFQFGWCTDTHGYTFAVDLEADEAYGKEVIAEWHELAKTAPIYLGYNTKFDMHMLKNIGVPYKNRNLSDVQYWVRAASDAIPEDRGGTPSGLKPFATRYVSRDARDMDKQIQIERSEIAKRYNKILVQYTGMKKGELDEFFKDKTNTFSELTANARAGFEYWREHCLPEYLHEIERTVETDDIRYTDVNRDTVIYYGHLDIVWTLEAYIVAKRIVKVRGNLKAVRIEEAQIYPLLRLERVGLRADINYLYESRARVRTYLRQRRQDLCMLYGGEIKVTQRDKIKEYITNRGFKLDGTTGDELKLLVDKLKAEVPGHDMIEFIETVLELRTLEKYNSTYIARMINEYVPETGRIYSQMNQTGAVSGRFSCNMQQQPKDPIKTKDGVELFHPRRAILATDDEHDAMVFLDFSAEELRLQAVYTILVSGGDLNLCRAYSPFKCHTEEGVHYDPFNQEHVDNSYTWDWFQDEDDQPWTPTDLHSATTKMCFPEVDPEADPAAFHRLRYVGKRTNFAKTYGATYTCIRDMFPEFSEEKCHEIDESYYKTFPGIKDYQNWVYAQSSREPYLENLFGIRYYGCDGRHLINYLIQGSGAYVLKTKLVEVDEYLIKNGYKSKMALSIHDEIVFYKHKDDPADLFFAIKDILQTHPGLPIKLVSDMEVATTNWAEKYEVERIEDFYETN